MTWAPAEGPAVVLVSTERGAPLAGVEAEEGADALAGWGEGGFLGDMLAQT